MYGSATGLKSWLRCAALGIVVLGNVAQADDDPAVMRLADSPEEPGAAPAHAWDFTAGLGAVNLQRYPGSRYDYTRVLPMVGVRYGRFFLGGMPDADTHAGLGVNLIQDPHFRFGVAVGTDVRQPRYASDDAVLRGWGDIKRTTHGTLFSGFDMEWFAVSGSVSQDIGGKHEGLVGNLSVLGLLHPAEKLSISVGPELTWGNTQYMQTFFGVNAAQAAIGGIQQHNAGGGLEDWRFGIGAQYQLSLKLSLGVRASYGKYAGEADDSPVTTSRDLTLYAIFLGYHF